MIIAILTGCPAGWILEGDICYKFVEDNKVFEEAESACWVRTNKTWSYFLLEAILSSENNLAASLCKHLFRLKEEDIGRWRGSNSRLTIILLLQVQGIAIRPGHYLRSVSNEAYNVTLRILLAMYIYWC